MRSVANLEFTPAGFDHAVRAFDPVDANSVPGLVPGQTVAIDDASADRRDVRIVAGTRRHLWANNLAAVAGFGLVLLVVSLLG